MAPLPNRKDCWDLASCQAASRPSNLSFIRRSTMGQIVADKDCEKIHFISPQIYCCGAGTAVGAELNAKGSLTR
jgi:hypothetical protein